MTTKTKTKKNTNCVFLTRACTVNTMFHTGCLVWGVGREEEDNLHIGCLVWGVGREEEDNLHIGCLV